MYRPAPIREFVTPAIYKSMEVATVNGRQQKQIVKTFSVRGKFKQTGTSELNANGLVVVSYKTEFITWWKDDFKAGDHITINGIEFQVYGNPENVEMRGRYAVLTLKKLEGGA